MEFTQEHATSLITMEEQLNNILDKLNDMDRKIDKSLTDHECRIRDVEIHGSSKVRDLDERVDVLEKCFGELRDSVNYERGRVAVMVIAIGAFISYLISKFS